MTVSDPDTQSQTQPRYEPISDSQIIQRLRRAANDGDLGADDQSRSMLAGYQPKLLLARFGDSAAHLIRESERWNALGTGEAERIVTATLAAFAEALDRVTVPPGVPAMATAQLAWNVERLQAGEEIGQRPSGYRRRRRGPRPSAR